MSDIERDIQTAEVATWCEGCGPHENLGVCSECGYPIEAGVHPDLASRLQGAVEDLRELCEALEGMVPLTTRKGGKTRLAKAWERARTRLDGGQ